MATDPKISGCIDILIEYKKGGYTLDQAVDRFRKLSGMREDVAREYIRSMSRDNIISLNTKRKALENDNEPDIAG
tara:strand:- start:119 stop:343 length:225 start_codon:yes stop_codon:yes gene_type:complete